MISIKITSSSVSLFTLIAFFLSAVLNAQDRYESTPLGLMTFGSCNRTDLDQGIWNAIAEEDADVWLWLGDIVYTDKQQMADLAEKYSLQKALPAYQDLMGKTKIFGVWDDHDFGKNDAGSAFKKKVESRELLFDFLDLSVAHPARKREGAYQSYSFGEGDQKTLVVLLDVRYFKEPYVRSNSPKQRYKKNEEGMLLGEAQWQWLETLLAQSDAKVHLFGGGIQLLSSEHPFEKWSNYPNARKRFVSLLKQYEIKNAIYLSGDRHIAELSAMELEESTVLYDFTSSGLTHAYMGLSEEFNPYRISPLIKQLNYGALQFDWEKQEIQFYLKGVKGEDLYQKTIVME